MAYVLAIEPDLRQATVLKRVIKEHAGAEIEVVDSRDGALSAIAARVPDVILLTALLSPRDEEELFSRLRATPGAEHVQTHTIPQLASAATPQAEGTGGRGVLGKLRRKKAEPQQIPGCDPRLFAEEVVAFLQRAAELKFAAASAPARGDIKVVSAPAATTIAHEAREDASHDELAQVGSAWASPFEWRPSSHPNRGSRAATHAPDPPLQSPEPVEDVEGRIARASRREADLAAERVRVEAEREAERLRVDAERAEERERERARVEAEREAERLRVEAEREKERQRVAAEREAERLRVEAERQKIEAERRKIEAERQKEAAEREKERLRAEAERQRLEAEAAAARRREAERLREEAAKEKERLRKQAEEEKARLRAEAERLRVEAERQKAAAEAERERIRLEAERQKLEAERVRQEAKRLRLEAEREAERLRLEAQREAERLRAQAEEEAERARAEEAIAAARTQEEARQRREAERARKRSAERARRHNQVMQDAFAEFRDDPVERPRGAVRLVPLAVWARFDRTEAAAVAAAERDELRELIKGLSIPPQVAGVSYPGGCRIRRVRVPASPQAMKALKSTGPVILSRRALDDVRTGGSAT